MQEEHTHMAHDHGHGGSFFVAFFLGAITGAAAALLLAPAPGEDTRRLIAERTREGREKASEAARQGRAFLDRQREHLTEAVERGREAYQRARTDETGTAGPAGPDAEPRT
jgi:gas vesicle protein